MRATGRYQSQTFDSVGHTSRRGDLWHRQCLTLASISLPVYFVRANAPTGNRTRYRAALRPGGGASLLQTNGAPFSSRGTSRRHFGYKEVSHDSNVFGFIYFRWGGVPPVRCRRSSHCGHDRAEHSVAPHLPASSSLHHSPPAALLCLAISTPCTPVALSHRDQKFTTS